MRKETRPATLRFTAAAAAVTIILLLRLSLAPWLGGASPFMLFVLAVLAASWYGGVGPGLAATALAAALGNWLLVEPAGQLILPAPGDRPEIAAFILVGAVLSIIIGGRHRSVPHSTTDASRPDSEARFRMMADHAPVLVWMTDADSQGVWFNRPWLEFVGRGMAQETGTGWTGNVHPEDVDLFRRTRAEALDAQRPFETEFRLRRHDGAWRWVMAKGVPLRDTRVGFAGLIGSCIDITDRKAAEETLREADRSKNDFMAALAHELRNPLAPIRNGLQILKAADEGRPTIAHTRKMMERQLEQMVKLIDDLLDVTRITQNQLELSTERVSLASVVQNAVETCQPVIEESGHELDIELPLARGDIQADPERLAQVFVNLLNNAVKYTPVGGAIRLAVETGEGSASVKISDTGVGIPAEQLPHIFKMFYQGIDTPGRPQGGLGIGLTLASALAELHGGHIEASSPGTGLGSEFAVHLPLLPGEAELEHGEPAVEPPAVMPGNQRILVVDDNVDAAESIGMTGRCVRDEIR